MQRARAVLCFEQAPTVSHCKPCGRQRATGLQGESVPKMAALGVEWKGMATNDQAKFEGVYAAPSAVTRAATAEPCIPPCRTPFGLGNSECAVSPAHADA
eukprot:13096333-Alexandrium_andersonii.AAC.1